MAAWRMTGCDRRLAFVEKVEVLAVPAAERQIGKYGPGAKN
jgi:hypothetical protein